jgi:hypothetical protein
MRPGLRAAGLLLLAALAPERAPAAIFDLTVIAYSGGPAPGVPGAVFESFSPEDEYFGHLLNAPLLNHAGQVVYWGRLASGAGGVGESNDTGIWGPGPGGSLAPVQREGEAIPGMPGNLWSESVWWDDLPAFALGDSGRLGTQLGGMYHVSNPAGALELLARWNAPLQGMPAPYEDEPLSSLYWLHVGDGDEVAFGAAVGFDLLGAFVRRSDGVNQLLGFYGQAAPGLPGRTFMHIGGPGVAAAGRVAFHGELTTPFFDNRRSVWTVEPDGSMQAIVLSGEPLPGAPPGTSVDHLYTLHGNRHGDFTFTGSILDSSGCTWDADCFGALRVMASGSPELVVRTGDPAPGAPPGALFRWIGELQLNAFGQLAFLGGVTSNNDQGIWGPAGSGFTLRARLGDPVPFAPGAHWAELGAPELNGRGELAFRGRYSFAAQGVTGIFFVSAGGVVEPVLRTGDLVEVAPGDIRQVSTIAELQRSREIAPRRSFNDRGEIAIGVGFSDGSGAIVKARVRRPRACGIGVELALLAPLAARATRARRR